MLAETGDLKDAEAECRIAVAKFPETCRHCTPGDAELRYRLADSQKPIRQHASSETRVSCPGSGKRAYRNGAGDLPESRRSQTREYLRFVAVWHSAADNLGTMLCEDGPAVGRRRLPTARRWQSTGNWLSTTPASPNCATGWQGGHDSLGRLLRASGKASEAEARARLTWRSVRRWQTTTPPFPAFPRGCGSLP